MVDSGVRVGLRRWLLSLLAGGLLTAAACQWGSSGSSSSSDEDRSARGIFQTVEPSHSGLIHTFQNGEEAGHYGFIESIGGGVGLFDYDRDGLLDVFVIGGGTFTGEDGRTIQGAPCKLFKNLGQMKFRDVTEEVGLDRISFYSQGCAVADYDRDGWPDLLVTGYGRLALFHNEPVDAKNPTKARKFVDRTREAGLIRDHFWSTGAAWADLDGDGYPDLYVCQYLDWSLDNNPLCKDYTGEFRDLCAPMEFKSRPHALYHNLGNGRFKDVSKEAGLRVPREPHEYDLLTHLSADAKQRLQVAAERKDFGKGLGVLMADFDGDGKPDIYVANDTTGNFLYLNRSQPGQIRLEDVGRVLGVATDDKGRTTGSMGVDIADYDHTGRPSIWVTNYENERHALYHNVIDQKGRMAFRYATQLSGISAIGEHWVGWGTGFIDLQNNGWEDLVIANGTFFRHSRSNDRRQSPVILRNRGLPQPRGQVQFVEATAEGGPYFRSLHSGRGVAFGDLDNDGCMDLVISHIGEPVAVLRNVATPASWLGIELATKDHRDFVGARVVLNAGSQQLTRFTKGGGSYLSANDPRIVFGLGTIAEAGRLTVFWPSGEPQVQHWEGLKVDRYHRLIQGQAAAEPATGDCH